MRGIERAKCSCGGKVYTKEPTDPCWLAGWEKSE
jgi:hypothetical protein